MKPGDLVKWRIAQTWVLGNVIYANGTIAQVRSNGNTYELDKTKLRLVPTCQQCGRLITSPHKKHKTKFCSRACSAASQTKNRCRRCGKHLTHSMGLCRLCSDALQRMDTIELVFRAIVHYKREHDGHSPHNRWIANAVPCGVETVTPALKHLASVGRIRISGIAQGREISITGAHWVYEEP